MIDISAIQTHGARNTTWTVATRYCSSEQLSQDDICTSEIDGFAIYVETVTIQDISRL